MLLNSRVVDYDSDQPVQSVLVKLIKQDGTVVATATTALDGKFTIDNDFVGDPYARLTFSRAGYATQTLRAASASNVDVVLPKAGTLAAVTVTLKQNKTKALLFAVIGAVAVWLFIKYRSKLKL